LIGLALVVASALPSADAATGTDVTMWVQPRANCSDERARAEAGSPRFALCSLARATALALPGDRIAVLPGRYAGTLEPGRSGSPGRPIRYAAPFGGVTLDAAGGREAIKLIGKSDLSFGGFSIVGATVQGIWVDASSRLTFRRMTVSGNAGPGIEIKDSASIVVESSRIASNEAAGIQEVGFVTEGRYRKNRIVRNGRGGGQFNGDGVQLCGRGAIVSASTISDNGGSSLYEHGIYASHLAVDYVIQGNTISGSSAADVKASGSGVVVGNTLGAARIGLYVSDTSGSGVSARRNVWTGPFGWRAVVFAQPR
jgi:parallel beta-helix repeat protein